jgi:hypothetical protein
MFQSPRNCSKRDFFARVCAFNSPVGSESTVLDDELRRFYVDSGEHDSRSCAGLGRDLGCSSTTGGHTPAESRGQTQRETYGRLFGEIVGTLAMFTFCRTSSTP